MHMKISLKIQVLVKHRNKSCVTALRGRKSHETTTQIVAYTIVPHMNTRTYNSHTKLTQ